MLIIHMLYVILLHLVLGYKLPELANLWEATYQTLIVILGDTTLWVQLHEEFTGLALWVAQFVIFSYPFLMGFLLLNFLLAVMGASFAKATAEVGQHPQQTRRVSLHNISVASPQQLGCHRGLSSLALGMFALVLCRWRRSRSDARMTTQ